MASTPTCTPTCTPAHPRNLITHPRPPYPTSLTCSPHLAAFLLLHPYTHTPHDLIPSPIPSPSPPMNPSRAPSHLSAPSVHSPIYHTPTPPPSSHHITSPLPKCSPPPACLHVRSAHLCKHPYVPPLPYYLLSLYHLFSHLKIHPHILPHILHHVSPSLYHFHTLSPSLHTIHNVLHPRSFLPLPFPNTAPHLQLINFTLHPFLTLCISFIYLHYTFSPLVFSHFKCILFKTSHGICLKTYQTINLFFQ